MAKFALVSIMALVAVSQDFVVYCFLGLFPPVDEGEAFPQALQSELAVHINSFLVSFEAVFLTYFVWKHFRIRSPGEDRDEIDAEAYDEHSLVSHSGVSMKQREAFTKNI